MVGMKVFEVSTFMPTAVLPFGMVNQAKALATSEGYHCQHSC
jgi:hypothetical protein